MCWRNVFQTLIKWYKPNHSWAIVFGSPGVHYAYNQWLFRGQCRDAEEWKASWNPWCHWQHTLISLPPVAAWLPLRAVMSIHQFLMVLWDPPCWKESLLHVPIVQFSQFYRAEDVSSTRIPHCIACCYTQGIEWADHSTPDSSFFTAFICSLRNVHIARFFFTKPQTSK